MSRSASLARNIIKLTNPHILALAVLLLIAYTQLNDPAVLFGLILVIFSFLVILPLGYVYLRILANGNRNKYIKDPTAYLRYHPKDIYILGIFSGLPCILVLLYLNSPPLLTVTLATLLATSLIVALFNFFYRVSYHIAAITILIIVIVLIWGQALFLLSVLLPITGWAKYRIREHNFIQLAVGFVVAVVVGFGMGYMVS